MVTNEQLDIALGVPVLANATLMALLIAYINARLQASDSKFEAKFEAVTPGWTESTNAWTVCGICGDLNCVGSRRSSTRD